MEIRFVQNNRKTEATVAQGKFQTKRKRICQLKRESLTDRKFPSIQYYQYNAMVFKITSSRALKFLQKLTQNCNQEVLNLVKIIIEK